MQNTQVPDDRDGITLMPLRPLNVGDDRDADGIARSTLVMTEMLMVLPAQRW